MNSRNQKKGRLSKVAGSILAVLGVFGVRGASKTGLDSISEFVVLTLFIVLGVTGAFLLRRGMRIMQKAGETILQEDKRDPIIYLRSFSVDNSDEPLAFVAAALRPLWRFVTIEESLALIFQKVGPMVAVGCPGELIQPQGIPRLYSSSEWQPFVKNLMRSSALILIRIGNTNGLWWEISEAIQLADPKRLLLACISTGDVREYKEFARRVNSLLPKPLPTQLNGAFYVWFESDWTPYLLRTPGNRFWTWLKLAADFNIVAQKSRAVALAPVFQHFGIQPISARLTRRAVRVLLAIIALGGLLMIIIDLLLL